MHQDEFRVMRSFDAGFGREGQLYSLPAVAKVGYPNLARLPVSIRILLESALRNHDGSTVTSAHVEALAGWVPNGVRDEIPFSVARVVLQDFTGTPLVCDLAAMRSAAVRLGKSPDLVEPLVPVQLVIDHSVQINESGTQNAIRRNMELEYERNRERYEFFKWGTQAFNTLTAVPPGFGIIHQVNLEALAKGVFERDGVYLPDTLVGTDSHTTMINGIGIVGWGVGGIEAESAMLGQPVYMVAPDVVGVHLTGALREGVTITDAVLLITEKLRQTKVVGKFVEFFGEGAANLTAMDRATIANMAPEYGATMGFFPVDDQTVAYYRATGRTEEEIAALQGYYKAQGLYGCPAAGDIDYSAVVEIDLSSIRPSVAGPKRPQDRIDLAEVSRRFDELYSAPVASGGYGRTSDIDHRSVVSPAVTTEGSMALALDVAADSPPDLGHGDILIAAITSCTNTSNPEVLLTAGLLARKAVERGLWVSPWIKTSFAPGSRVVTDYLGAAGLLPALEQLGFGVAAYGCGVCAGNSGPLEPAIDATIARDDLVCAAVLSGNRNFEARIHPALRANFLMSPPLVIAYAIAGSVRVDLFKDALGTDPDGAPVTLADIWPTPAEIDSIRHFANDPEAFRKVYADKEKGGALWDAVESPVGATYPWPHSTYIAEPPLFEGFTEEVVPPAPVSGARILAILGDSITTDHISPAGIIKTDSPAGRWLQERQIAPAEFNTYGTRRGQHEVMVRGTFANVRLRNLMLPGSEGGVTAMQPSGEVMSIFDASEAYRKTATPLVILAGEEYGQGSSRDWAAKGTFLLGVRAVIARSFERIHRSNLIGMGVLPCQFMPGESAQSLGLDGSEVISIDGMTEEIAPRSILRMTAVKPDGSVISADVQARVDSAIETEYFRHGGVPKYVLRKLLFS
ncbi:aconitate hydratase [Agaricicola taiwanensis]|uniref:Aconitate hydratase n=1 Tax=Agaricicola taiwanensis TaxID=591372 RepID=A0A8J2YHV1_9RHOB|nr:aconitate hydratase AcnA [Agaricicola taiwanensis]GGE43581.1 aconitate hydratase [Agaricicola taiwanensis]